MCGGGVREYLSSTSEQEHCLPSITNPSSDSQKTVVIEGNGTRPSHKGDGYSESDVMYTLNSTEHHAVCYATQACGDRDNPSQSYQEELAYTIPANPMSDRGQAIVCEKYPKVYTSNKASFHTSFDGGGYSADASCNRL